MAISGVTDSDVLDEIFADESITSMVSGKSFGTKGLDVKI